MDESYNTVTTNLGALSTNMYDYMTSILSNPSIIIIIVIDTNLIDKYNSLIEKFEKYSNLIIGNHMKVQQYIIDNYAPSISDEHNK